MQAASLRDVLHTRITRRLVRRLGTDSHGRLVWQSAPAPAPAAGGRRASVGVASRASVASGGDDAAGGAPRSRTGTDAEDEDEEDESGGVESEAGAAGGPTQPRVLGYTFEFPEGSDESVPRGAAVSQQQHQQREAAALGRRLAVAARTTLVRLARAGEVVARLEQRWGAMTTLDMSHTFIPGACVAECTAPPPHHCPTPPPLFRPLACRGRPRRPRRR
jgi:hypothetical protein